jgi:prophage antirepressor-like protein
MNAVKIFENAQFGQIRTSISASGEPLFCLADVCKALDLGNPSQVKTRLRKDGVISNEGVSTTTNQHGKTSKQVVAMNFITEPNLYKCIFQSRKTEAEAFQDWVCGEVLPSIRKTGRYCTGKPKQNTSQLLNAKMKVASWVIKTLNLSEASKLAIAKSIADPLGLPTPDYVKTPDATAAASQLLKECGAKMSALAFNRMLVQQGFLAEMERTAAKEMRKTFKCITKKGLYYGENGVSPHNPKETQPRWYVSKFKDLLSVVTNNMKETEANNG